MMLLKRSLILTSGIKRVGGLLIIVCLCFVLVNMVHFHRINPWGNVSIEELQEHTLHDNLTCFLKHRTFEGYPSSNKLHDINHSRIANIFNRLMETFAVKTAIIEPSILYCLLNNHHKYLLTRNKFNMPELGGSLNVITYGIFEEDVKKLLKGTSVNRMHRVGLHPHFIRDQAPAWLPNGKRLKNDTYITHMLLYYFEFTIHVVVFYERSTYMWHAGLDYELNIVDKKFLFDNSSAYEKFTMVPLTESTTLPDIYIPSSPHHFLFQIPTSRFLECNSNKFVDYENHTTKHGKVSAEEFNNNTILTIRNLKSLLHPLLTNFWIFSGTMLGWYRECDIIPYTHDVDFAAWAYELEDIKPIVKFGYKNDNLTLDLRMGLLEEALEFRFYADSLVVDLFFLYQISNGSWTAGHRPSKHLYFRYFYPHFTLCSTELLGEKVLVPCETEEIIVTEYGENWREPVEYWDYQSSIKNRGPNIYWDEETQNKTFEEF